MKLTPFQKRCLESLYKCLNHCGSVQEIAHRTETRPIAVVNALRALKTKYPAEIATFARDNRVTYWCASDEVWKLLGYNPISE